MNRRWTRVWPGLGVITTLIVVAAGFFVVGQIHPGLPPRLVALGHVRLVREGGSTLTLSEAVVPHAATLLTFWASWCGPCHGEAAQIAALRQRYQANDLNVLYLNVDDIQDAAATAAFLRSSRAEGLAVLYAGHAGWRTITGTRAVTLPRSYVFDRSGTPIAAFVGFDGSATRDDLARSVAKAVAS